MIENGLAEFIAEQAPLHASAHSAIMEWAARESGLRIRRADRRLIYIEIQGISTPFVDMNGPNSSLLARTLCGHIDRQRQIIRACGLAVPRYSVFRSSALHEAISYAEDIGWPVTIMPASLARDPGAATNLKDPAQLNAAWRAAWKAYADRDPGGRVMVEEYLAGEEFRFFVVGRQVAAVTKWSAGREQEHEVIEPTREIQKHVAEFALAAIGAMPGMAYGAIDLVVRDLSETNASREVWFKRIEVNVTRSVPLLLPSVQLSFAGAILRYYRHLADANRL